MMKMSSVAVIALTFVVGTGFGFYLNTEVTVWYCSECDESTSYNGKGDYCNSCGSEMETVKVKKYYEFPLTPKAHEKVKSEVEENS